VHRSAAQPHQEGGQGGTGSGAIVFDTKHHSFFEKAQIYKSPDEELENQIEMRSGKRRDDKEKEEEEEEGEEEEKESIHEVPEMELATQAMVIDRDLKVRGIVNVGVDDQLIIPVGLQDKEFELETSDWKVSQLKSLLGSLPKNG
jgi:type I site-specific restriction-modification system R (restriction) subunit